MGQGEERASIVADLRESVAAIPVGQLVDSTYLTMRQLVELLLRFAEHYEQGKHRVDTATDGRRDTP